MAESSSSMFLRYLQTISEAASALVGITDWQEALQASAELVATNRPAPGVALWLAEAEGTVATKMADAGKVHFPGECPLSPSVTDAVVVVAGGDSPITRFLAKNKLAEATLLPIRSDRFLGAVAIADEARPRAEIRAADQLFAALLGGFVATARRTEDALDEAEGERWQLYQALYSSPALISVCRGREHRFEFVNEPFVRAYRPFLQRQGQQKGGDSGAFVGKTMRDVFSPRFARMQTALLDQVYRSREPYAGEELALDPQKGGENRYLNLVHQPLLDGNGEVSGILTHGCDATNEVRARREAADAQNLYSQLVEEIHGVVWEADPAFSSFTYVSRQAEDITGYPAENFYREGFWVSLVHPDDIRGVRATTSSNIIGRDRFALDYRLKTASGELVWIRDVVQVIRDPNGVAQRLRGLMLDNTQRRHAQQDRERMKEKLLQVQKLEGLGVLAGGIAHDFNNLLTGILGNASLIQMELASDHELRSRIDSVVSAANRAADLTRQLLAYSGKGHFVVTTIHLSDHIREIVELLKASVPKKVVLKLDLDDEIPSVDADSAQLQQVIMNLVINGAEAITKRSGKVIVSTGEVKFERETIPPLVGGHSLDPGNYVFLRVEDNGCGIDEKDFTHIFDPFFSTKPAGRGLGMAAVLGIVQGHNGGIAIESTVGKGSIFRVYFPVTTMDLTQDMSVPMGPVTGGGVVLLIDDEEEVRDAAAAMLEHLGYGVIVATNGSQGLSLFKEFRDELVAVLLDMTMPEMTGEEVFEQLKVLGPDVPVILSSGFDRLDSARRLTAQNQAMFLRKPYSLKDLAKVLPG